MISLRVDACSQKWYSSSKEIQLAMRWGGGRMVGKEVESALDLEK